MTETRDRSIALQRGEVVAFLRSEGLTKAQAGRVASWHEAEMTDLRAHIEELEQLVNLPETMSTAEAARLLNVGVTMIRRDLLIPAREQPTERVPGKIRQLPPIEGRAQRARARLLTADVLALVGLQRPDMLDLQGKTPRRAGELCACGRIVGSGRARHLAACPALDAES